MNYAQDGRQCHARLSGSLAPLLSAPDWLESEVRSLYRALDPKRGAIMRQDIAAHLRISSAAPEVLTMNDPRQPHPESPIWRCDPARRRGTIRFHFATLPTDFGPWRATSTEKFIAGNSSPLTVRPAIEFLTKPRQTQGRGHCFQEARDLPPDEFFVPIPRRRSQESTTVDVDPELVSKSLGASVYTKPDQRGEVGTELAKRPHPSAQLRPEPACKHQVTPPRRRFAPRK